MNPHLRALFAAGDGVATIQDIQATLSRREIRRMLRNHQLTKVLPGIYALGTPDKRTLLSALDLHCGEAVVVCMSTAAAVFGFNTESNAVLHVLDPERHRLHPTPWLAVHRRDGAPVIECRGRPVTEPVWTAIEVARSLSRPRALATLDAALSSGTCDRAGLEAAAQAQRGRRGIAAVRKLIALASPLAESPMESEARLAMIDGGLTGFVEQHKMIDRDGREWRVDFAWPEFKLAIEYDGFDYHKSPTDLARDREKDNALREAGWTVLHITADDVRRHPEVMLRRIRQHLVAAAA
ncbi:type IV toxin-antitoxin system AbiEi family antitoxin domain-containing protein [Mycolicibacterium brumae]|uniref:DUF559 domain-containing protein n=1 Tax=Mycolicibacterium brumae TaxID=85968 RepID=A0A2G5PEN8_9MYCO|nr:type IV toxin-antitoxin system AbiEi family antitoxin domain-containing protein [Mycolicibacterium brumae]MCV7192008.1 type IV toxin-antitoxin system AbiEi family antitoxin domain-containing protein [Mycolicibacterium brumae]PIB76787.1 DUF559 domain-containing protein [Mycolicibacterium brumae]RWA20676.1 hypothetical protein MBRU_03185 [Mycolicibacterium brumae DSM 44177]UWW07774.1 DUF559 domain-containing protein [Mycolicibacterium brumae]